MPDYNTDRAQSPPLEQPPQTTNQTCHRRGTSIQITTHTICLWLGQTTTCDFNKNTGALIINSQQFFWSKGFVKYRMGQFATTMGLPYKHILAIRRCNGLEMYGADAVNVRWTAQFHSSKIHPGCNRTRLSEYCYPANPQGSQWCQSVKGKAGRNNKVSCHSVECQNSRTDIMSLKKWWPSGKGWRKSQWLNREKLRCRMRYRSQQKSNFQWTQWKRFRNRTVKKYRNFGKLNTYWRTYGSQEQDWMKKQIKK